MNLSFTDSQLQRLKDFGVDDATRRRCFASAAERDKIFQQITKTATQNERRRLRESCRSGCRPRLSLLENRLAQLLADKGFVQVNTPMLMSKGLLAKMGIDAQHPLNEQIFWVGPKQCLRPMLAPHLYYVVKDLLRLLDKPVGIFEIGACFRKETQGAAHANEFTMLNLAEFGLDPDQRHERIRQLGDWVLEAAGVSDCRFETETSEVYGDTIDIVCNADDMELASAAMGPHPLDANWRVTEPWVGLGFGLERLLMATDPDANMRSLGRSLTYLDGIRLNI